MESPFGISVLLPWLIHAISILRFRRILRNGSPICFVSASTTNSNASACPSAILCSVNENPNIEILFETQAEGLFGENGVEGVHLVKGKDTAHEERYDLPIDGFFLAIGHKPNTDIFKHSITLDENGYIVTAPHTTETNIEGVFAAGDVADPQIGRASCRERV